MCCPKCHVLKLEGCERKKEEKQTKSIMRRDKSNADLTMKLILTGIIFGKEIMTF